MRFAYKSEHDLTRSSHKFCFLRAQDVAFRTNLNSIAWNAIHSFNCSSPSRYRPDLVDFQALDPAAWAENCQLAFDVLEQDLGIGPAMTGRELAASKNPDKLTMMSYLSQIYEAFRKEIPAVKQKRLMNHSDEDLLEYMCPPR